MKLRLLGMVFVLMLMNGSVIAERANQFYDPGPGQITTAVWNTQGDRVAAGYGDGTLRIWDDIGTLLATFDAHTASIEAIAWHTDDSLLATASKDLTVRLWSTTAVPWEPQRIDFDGREFVRDLAWSDDRLFGVTADDAASQTFWEWDQRGRVLHAQGLPFGSGDQVAVHPTTETRLAIGKLDTVYILDLPTFTILETINFSTDHNETVMTLKWSSDGSRLMTGHLSGYLRVIEVDSTTTQQIFEDVTTSTPATLRGVFWNDTALDVAFGPDENTIIAVGADGTIRQWDLGSGDLLHEQSLDVDTPLWAAAIHPGGAFVAHDGPDADHIQFTPLATVTKADDA